MCRNCVKSKRECLGYDPVFKAPSTPSAIQPAPNPPPSLVVNPQDPPTYPGAPPGYVPAVSQPFAPSLQSESPAPSSEQFDQGTTVDPSLQGSTASNMASLQNATDGGLQPQVNTTTIGATAATESSSFKGTRFFLSFSACSARRLYACAETNMSSSEASSDNGPYRAERHPSSPSPSHCPNSTESARRNTGSLSRHVWPCH